MCSTAAFGSLSVIEGGGMADPNSDVFHWLWNLVLTAILGIVGWHWDKITTKLDGLEKDKAERTRVDQLERDMLVKAEMSDITTLRTEIESWRRSSDDQHRENRSRLDQILNNQAARLEYERRRFDGIGDRP
jgi:hypothetical protein